MLFFVIDLLLSLRNHAWHLRCVSAHPIAGFLYHVSPPWRLGCHACFLRLLDLDALFFDATKSMGFATRAWSCTSWFVHQLAMDPTCGGIHHVPTRHTLQSRFPSPSSFHGNPPFTFRFGSFPNPNPRPRPTKEARETGTHHLQRGGREGRRRQTREETSHMQAR